MTENEYENMQPTADEEQLKEVEQLVRPALLKEAMGDIDAEAAWNDFERRRTAVEANERRSDGAGRIKWLSMGVLAGIAASMLIGWLLWPNAAADMMLVSARRDCGTDVMLYSTGKTPADSMEGSVIKTGTLDLTSASARQEAAIEKVVETPRGKVMKIVLADGTEVLLNNESRLRFPSRFTGDSRTVHLEGEALFTVAKDPQHPFVVKSQGLSTTALGTQFNVSTFDGKPVVTLIEGKVEVADEKLNEKLQLSPGQRVQAESGGLKLKDADVRRYVEWKEGYFYFDNVPLIDVLEELGRWYNVDIELLSPSLMSYRLHFVADRSSGMADVVERLNHFSYMTVGVHDGKVVVRKREKSKE